VLIATGLRGQTLAFFAGLVLTVPLSVMAS
jgi:hypothetical protein